MAVVDRSEIGAIRAACGMADGDGGGIDEFRT
jgi:hypothetical protein